MGVFGKGDLESQALLDEAAVLACMAYVDLNPIRAGIEALREESDYTSIQQRINDLASRGVGRPRKSEKHEKSGKLSNGEATVSRKSPTLYPFNRGFDLKEGEQALPFSLDDYMGLIDWTGRAVRDDKRGSIPERAPPILERLGLSVENWLKFVPEVERSFTHAVGQREKLIQFASKFEVAWLRGRKMASSLYAN